MIHFATFRNVSTRKNPLFTHISHVLGEPQNAPFFQFLKNPRSEVYPPEASVV